MGFSAPMSELYLQTLVPAYLASLICENSVKLCVCVLTHEKDPIVSVAYASYPPTFLSIPIDFLTEATQSTQ